MTRVLVTGATGFVGRRLVPALRDAGYDVRAAVRESAARVPEGVEIAHVADVGPDTDWAPALKDVDIVVHLAARVHLTRDRAVDPLSEFRRVNRDGTRRLAEAAADAGITHFILVSTSKVMGEESGARPFIETDTPRPVDPYGISKWEAEQALARIAAATGLAVTVLRPPLVYGPGAGGNVEALLKVCRRAPPLPFAAVDNRRSVVFVGNLVDAILRCLERPEARGKTYFVRDADVSTPELIRLTATAMGRTARLFTAPDGILRLLGRLTGRSGTVSRLLGTLQVNDAAFRHDLGWTPPVDVVQGLSETAAGFPNGDRRRDEGGAPR